MPWDVHIVLLPLLGGYWFFAFCYRLRARGLRLAGYRLLFEAMLVGIFLTVPIRGLVLLLKRTEIGTTMAEYGGLAYGSSPFAGTAVATFLFALIAPFGVNLAQAARLRAKSQLGGVERRSNLLEWYSEYIQPVVDYSFDREVFTFGDSIARLLYSAVTRPQTQPAVVEIETTTGQVLRGFVKSFQGLGDSDPFVQLVPIQVGFREDDHRVSWEDTSESWSPEVPPVVVPMPRIERATELKAPVAPGPEHDLIPD